MKEKLSDIKLSSIQIGREGGRFYAYRILSIDSAYESSAKPKLTWYCEVTFYAFVRLFSKMSLEM